MSSTVEASPESVDAPPRFEDLNLAPGVLQAVLEKGYTHPTPIQAQAIPVLLEGRDLIGGSQTGTGKTAAFCLPILTRLQAHDDAPPRVLILEPTRELAHQVEEQLEAYSRHTDIKLALLHGGVRYGKQTDALKAGADIVVATPGRLIDHLGQKNLTLKGVDILVLDEADRMLDMGFLPDVKKILSRVPNERQSLLFSATIPPAIERLSQQMLRDPVQIRIGGGRQPAATIQHAIYPIDERQKFDLLVALLESLEYKSILIFTRTKRNADTVSRWLEAAGHKKVGVLHADRTQKMRDRALADFKSGESDILVATDIVARGIDISGVSHVINYDIPEHPEDYVHRIGRTGRAEREGDAVTLYTASDAEHLRAIERFIKMEIPRQRLEGFDYTWTPALNEGDTPTKRKRNRGYQKSVSYKFTRGRRR